MAIARGSETSRAGTVGLAIPRLRHGSYFLLFPERRRRAAGRALASAAATPYRILSVHCLVATRRLPQSRPDRSGAG